MKEGTGEAVLLRGRNDQGHLAISLSLSDIRRVFSWRCSSGSVCSDVWIVSPEVAFFLAPQACSLDRVEASPASFPPLPSSLYGWALASSLILMSSVKDRRLLQFPLLCHHHLSPLTVMSGGCYESLIDSKLGNWRAAVPPAPLCSKAGAVGWRRGWRDRSGPRGFPSGVAKQPP